MERQDTQNSIYRANNGRVVGIQVVREDASYVIGLYVAPMGRTTDFIAPQTLRKILTYDGSRAVLDAEIQRLSRKNINPEEAFSELENFVNEHNMVHDVDADPSCISFNVPDEDARYSLNPDDDLGVLNPEDLDDLRI